MNILIFLFSIFLFVSSSPYQKKFRGIVNNVKKFKGTYRQGGKYKSCFTVSVHAIKLNSLNETIDNCVFTKKYTTEGSAKNFKLRNPIGKHVIWRKSKKNSHKCANSRHKFTPAH